MSIATLKNDVYDILAEAVEPGISPKTDRAVICRGAQAPDITVPDDNLEDDDKNKLPTGPGKSFYVTYQIISNVEVGMDPERVLEELTPTPNDTYQTRYNGSRLVTVSVMAHGEDPETQLELIRQNIHKEVVRAVMLPTKLAHAGDNGINDLTTIEDDNRIPAANMDIMFNYVVEFVEATEIIETVEISANGAPPKVF